MIIIDMNQVMISNLMFQLKKDELNENLVRHMVLKSIVSYEKKYKQEYGEDNFGDIMFNDQIGCETDISISDCIPCIG